MGSGQCSPRAADGDGGSEGSYVSAPPGLSDDHALYLDDRGEDQPRRWVACGEGGAEVAGARRGKCLRA
eukprot:7213553-Lingulodinium_polyedra.AAC.1